MQKDFSYPLKIDELGQGEQSYKLSADKDELKILAEILQVPAVNSFEAKIKLNFKKKQGELKVTGTVKANLHLISVISLTPFDKDYSTDFEMLYDTNASYEDVYGEDEDIELDVPDIVIDGKIDLVDIAIEQLALVMEDYPRLEGEEFEAIIEDDGDDEENIANNPFAVLKKLKENMEG
jgi:uncharacterized metal-binding protein YceD (DUF177 family)